MLRGSPLLDQPAAHNVGKRVRVGPRAHAALLDLAGEDCWARTLEVVLTIAPAVDLEHLDADAIARGEDELRARAVVELGSGGHRTAIELDVARGLALTVAGSSIRVTAHNDGAAPVELGAFVSYALARAGAPTLTLFGPSLADGEVWTFDVPMFVASVEVLALDHALRVEVGRGRAGDRWLYAEELDRGRRMPRPLPIANGCARMRVTNHGPGTAAPIAIFTLAL